ncbi:MAG: SDR family oxidoreductase [Cytophagaceae bacterium]|nr:SDR family oxidoreductase [Cytophagaceae bacterium]
MNLNLKGKNALVGGSSKGIGWATAMELAILGANVTLVSRTENSLVSKLALLPNDGSQSHDFQVLDYENLPDFEKKVDIIEKQYHIIINNSGGPAGGNIIEEPTEKFEAVFRQHLETAQILAQRFVPFMQSEGFGRIVNIISVSVKQPIVGLGVSNCIRYAVAAWAKTLSKEIANRGITVNNVLPGYTLTDRLEEVFNQKVISTGISKQELIKEIIKSIPTGKIALPEEVAAAVAFLCSPAAASVNGINLPVDGGMSMSL